MWVASDRLGYADFKTSFVSLYERNLLDSLKPSIMGAGMSEVQ